VAAEDNSLATAQASVAGTVEDEADPAPASTAAQDTKTVVPVHDDAGNLASMEDSVYNSSSSSSSSSLEDHPGSASAAPQRTWKWNPLMKNLILSPQMLQCCILLLYHSSLLAGHHQQTLGDGSPQPPLKESTNPGPALADPGGWV